MLKKKKFWKWFIGIVILLPILLFTLAITLVYYNQESIVQHFVKTANEDFKGEITIKGSHIAPFANFPYISIDIEGFSVHEDKNLEKTPVVDIQDLYIGFDLWTMLSGDFSIKSIKLENGNVNIVEYSEDDLNIMRAFKTYEEKEIEDVEEEFHLDLQEILVTNVDINKLNRDSLKFDAFVNDATVKFRTVKEHLYFSLDSDFDFSLIEKGDTSFINKKKIITDASLDYLKDSDIIKIFPSKVDVADAQFDFSGEIDVLDNFNVDIDFSGQKPDFSLIIGLTPDELIPVFNTFENRGDVFFNAQVKGPSINGFLPSVNAKFGCEDGFFKNPRTLKTLEDLSFVATYTNGEERSLATSKFEIKDFNAKPEQGDFKVNLTVENFESPDVDLNLVTVFDLEYLSEFLNVDQLTELSGRVELETNFHDIIDLDNPEKAIEELNQSYYTALKVDRLAFRIPGYEKKIRDINVDLQVDGNKADLRTFNFKVGGSDLSMTGSINDLPAILHHTNDPIVSNLKISSKALDVNELTLAGGDNSVDEYIRNFKMDVAFESSAKALTESPYLPIGKFRIDDFNAELTNYPHALHDFNVNIDVDTSDLKIHQIGGMIDQSDFKFEGLFKDYSFWFQDSIVGDANLEFDLSSNLFQFKDIFTVDGENYVPEDYREEELRNFKLHGVADLHFLEEGLHSADVDLTEFTAKMNLHPLKLNNFKGRIHLEGDHFTLEKFGGNIGRTNFDMDLEYFFGEDKNEQVKDNMVAFRSKLLDFDELFDYEAPEPVEPVEHDSVFSIFDVPFPNMSYSTRINRMKYHLYDIRNIKADLRTTEDHKLYIDTLQMDLAGGHMDIGGYFNGTDRNNIYFSPNIAVYDINLDKLMLKFDNFGQDEVLSDNLHGIITGKIYGEVKMHADLVPIISDSDLKIDVDIVGGSIENYGPLQALSGYFEDDKLHKVLFDTLQNNLTLKDGEMVVPEMLINTNLGFIKVSGKQDVDYNMEYYLRVPLKMVTGVGARKLFNRRKEEADPEEISEYDPNKRYRYVNIKIVGDAEDFKVSLGKNRNK